MPIERFFDLNFQQSDKFGKLEGDEFTHATKVFRIHVSDRFEIINGHGCLAEVEAIEITKKYLTYKVHNVHFVPRGVPKLTLVLGMPKFNRLETIVEKVTEIGCDQIIMFNADRSEKTDLSKNQWERLNLILQASLKQCGRLHLPAIELISDLDKVFESDRTYLFGDLNAKKPIQGLFQHNLGLIIGPESGFSDKELILLNKKAKGILLSDATLRVDTAAICGMYLLSSQLLGSVN